MLFQRFNQASLCLGTIILLLISGTVGLTQEPGIVRGKVVDVYSGNPLPNANVLLVGTQRGAATDQDGSFVINRVPPSEYQLKVLYIGYESPVRLITVKPGKKFLLNLIYGKISFKLSRLWSRQPVPRKSWKMCQL